MMCPHDFVASNSTKDSLNFFQSSTRIHVGCAFGEIDRQFVAFWRPLEGSLDGHKYTTESCFRFYNLVLDFREEMKAEGKKLDEEFEFNELTVASNIFNLDNPAQTIRVV